MTFWHLRWIYDMVILAKKISSQRPAMIFFLLPLKSGKIILRHISVNPRPPTYLANAPPLRTLNMT